MKQNRLLSLCLPLLLISIFSCRKSSTSPELPPGPPLLLSLSVVDISVPANAPANVRTLVGEGLRDLSTARQFFDLAKGKAPQGVHPTWSWRTELAPYQITIQATRNNDETVAWELRMNGQAGGSVSLNNWLAAEVTAAAEAKSGTFKYYVLNTTTLSSEGNWRIDAQNAKTINVQTNGKNFAYLSNADRSGNFQVQDMNGRKTFEASWDTNGAGMWAEYDPISGQVTGNGTW